MRNFLLSWIFPSSFFCLVFFYLLNFYFCLVLFRNINKVGVSRRISIYIVRNPHGSNQVYTTAWYINLYNINSSANLNCIWSYYNEEAHKQGFALGYGIAPKLDIECFWNRESRKIYVMPSAWKSWIWHSSGGGLSLGSITFHTRRIQQPLSNWRRGQTRVLEHDLLALKVLSLSSRQSSKDLQVFHFEPFF